MPGVCNSEVHLPVCEGGLWDSSHPQLTAFLSSCSLREWQGRAICIDKEMSACVIWKCVTVFMHTQTHRDTCEISILFLGSQLCFVVLDEDMFVKLKVAVMQVSKAIKEGSTCTAAPSVINCVSGLQVCSSIWGLVWIFFVWSSFFTRSLKWMVHAHQCATLLVSTCPRGKVKVSYRTWICPFMLQRQFEKSAGVPQGQHPSPAENWVITWKLGTSSTAFLVNLGEKRDYLLVNGSRLWFGEG